MKCSFVVRLTPFSFNSRTPEKRAIYRKAFSEALAKKYNRIPRLEGDLHGRVFFITVYEDNPDADNISKPVWDALSGVLYDDDKVVRHRDAVVMSFDEFDFSQTEHIEEFDFYEIQQAHWDEEDVLFVELLPFDEWKVEFGMQPKKS